jgi:hypothetical protein
LSQDHEWKGEQIIIVMWALQRKSYRRYARKFNLVYVLLTVHLSIILDNDQLDAHLIFYFTIHLLKSSTCFEHYMLIIRKLNCTDAASGIILSVSGRPVHTVHRTATAA